MERAFFLLATIDKSSPESHHGDYPAYQKTCILGQILSVS